MGKRQNDDPAKVLALAQGTCRFLEELVIVEVELLEVAKVAGIGEMCDTCIQNLISRQVEHFQVLEGIDLHILTAFGLEIIVADGQIRQTHQVAIHGQLLGAGLLDTIRVNSQVRQLGIIL